MVKNRGIEICIISQLDIRRLPEYADSSCTDGNESNLVSCYVPIHPGSQIWLEYTVEPPHPPKASYLFKLFLDGKAITAWDCTEKYGYHGKMIYILDKAESDELCPGMALQRRGLRFSIFEGVNESVKGIDEDCLEIRVYRIEHRQRVRDQFEGYDDLNKYFVNQFQLIDGGFLEPGLPRRRYKYQLLDAKDEPYAVFRFCCRTYEYLRQNNIITVPTASTCSSLSQSTVWYDAYSNSATDSGRERQQGIGWETRINLNTEGSDVQKSPPKQTVQSALDRVQRFSADIYLPLSASDGSLSVVARDSIEDLPSTVPRSPESRRSQRTSIRDSTDSATLPVQKLLSPRQRLAKRLTLDLDKAKSLIDTGKRPLSPFTSGGLLRHIISPDPPPLTPTEVTKPAPNVDDDVFGSSGLKRTGSKRERFQQSTERGRKSLIGFLGRKAAG